MFIQTQTLSFKTELPQAVHNLLTDSIYIALYTSSASLTAATTAYTSTGEVSAAGYTAGGQLLTSPQISSDAATNTVYVSFASPVWTGAITARGALIYNFTKSNKSIAVLDFGADKTSVNTFTVTMPAHSATTALLRFSN